MRRIQRGLGATLDFHHRLPVRDVQRIGVLGGTFDPIHFGHLDAAAAARRALGLDDIHLVPARTPPHKAATPLVSTYHRIAMVALAATGHPELRISDIELDSADPSYTSLTLQRLATAGHSPAQLFFITGADAFADIASWHDYPAVLGRSHFVVVSRAGCAAPDLRRRLPDLAERMHRAKESIAPMADAGTTAIWLVDAPTRPISSSDVRERLNAGRPIDGLVPPAVETYITRHELYLGQGD